MKLIKLSAVVLFAVFPFLATTSLALDYFEVSKPSIKKATIYVSAEKSSNLNRQFVNQLKSMLAASLLFENVNSKANSDYSITLSSEVESKDLLVSIKGEKQGTYKNKYFGIRFKNTEESYVDRKTAQMANRIIKEFFGIQGSVGSKLTWSVAADPRKIIYKRDFAVDAPPTQVTFNFYSNYGVSWNPKRDHIIYTSHTDFGTVINIQQVEPLVYFSTEVYRQSGSASSPTWAPDGTVYLTLHVSDQNSDIFQFQLNAAPGGTTPIKLNKIRQMTHIPSIETEPVISPDNKFMAFVSDQTSEPQIYLLELTSKKSRRITRIGGYNVSPAFSPNGKYLAYRGIRGGQSAIYRIDLVTGEEKQVTPDSVDAEEPTWSPDASLIAFTGKTGKNQPSKIYYTLSSGGRFYRLTNSGPETVETAPHWGPALH